MVYLYESAFLKSVAVPLIAFPGRSHISRHGSQIVGRSVTKDVLEESLRFGLDCWQSSAVFHDGRQTKPLTEVRSDVRYGLVAQSSPRQRIRQG